MKTVIVGGVAGGMSAATRLRRLDEAAEIVVFERGPHVSYANCGLPYYVGGVIRDRASLLLQTPASLAARFRLDVRTGHEVVGIDPAAKTVAVLDLSSEEVAVEGYDELILAVGASARGAAAGSGIPIHTLRTVEDVDAIDVLVTAAADRLSALVVGGGFIGLEAAENLVRRGIHTTLVQRGPHILSPLDPEMTTPIDAELHRRGVDVRTSVTIERIEDGDVLLTDGTVVRPSFIIDASGVVPNVALARTAGLRLGPTGGIAVDAQNRTSDPHIYAVGDGVEKIDAISEDPALVTMAGLANRHGRSVADVISGRDDQNTPSLGTAIVKVFDVVAAKTGWSERQLVAADRPHRVIHTHPASHATYYPGATVDVDEAAGGSGHRCDPRSADRRRRGRGQAHRRDRGRDRRAASPPRGSRDSNWRTHRSSGPRRIPSTSSDMSPTTSAPVRPRPSNGTSSTTRSATEQP